MKESEGGKFYLHCFDRCWYMIKML